MLPWLSVDRCFTQAPQWLPVGCTVQEYQDSQVLQAIMYWAGIGGLGIQGLAVWLNLVIKLLLAIRVKRRVAAVVQQFAEVLQREPQLREVVERARAAGRPLVLQKGSCIDRWMLPAAGVRAGLVWLALVSRTLQLAVPILHTAVQVALAGSCARHQHSGTLLWGLG